MTAFKLLDAFISPILHTLAYINKHVTYTNLCNVFVTLC